MGQYPRNDHNDRPEGPPEKEEPMSQKIDAEELESDDQAADRPGQVDSQRGRGAYSAAEKAYDASSERATAKQHGREHGDSEKSAILSQQQRSFDLSLNYQATVNALQTNFINALQVVQVLALASQATSNDSGSNSLVSAIGEIMSKTAGVTPPVTVVPVKGA